MSQLQDLRAKYFQDMAELARARDTVPPETKAQYISDARLVTDKHPHSFSGETRDAAIAMLDAFESAGWMDEA